MTLCLMKLSACFYELRLPTEKDAPRLSEERLSCISDQWVRNSISRKRAVITQVGTEISLTLPVQSLMMT